MSPDSHPKLVSSGYVALDVVQTAQGSWLRAGGSAANVACNLAHFGWQASIVALLGDDDAATVVIRDLQAAGVDTSGIHKLPSAGTPIVVHEVEANGHRYRFGCKHCGRAYVPHRPLPAVAASAMALNLPAPAVFYFDRASAGALTLAAAHRHAGRTVIYEPSTAGRPAAHRQAAVLASIVKYSRERSAAFADALGPVADGQVRIETRGSEGSAFRIGAGDWQLLPSCPIRAVDAGGAGDWMTAALIDVLQTRQKWSERHIRRAIEFAQAVAAISCLLPGARTLSNLMDRGAIRIAAAKLARGITPFIPRTEPSPNKAVDTNCAGCSLPLSPASGASV